MSQVRCYCNLYLLSFIVTMHWTKFLYELYSNSRVLIHYIEGHYFILFIVSIIGCHNCSYSAILIVFCTIKFSSMTLSLSLIHVHWVLCYRIKNISFMVFIKQLKPRIFVQCNCCYTDWSLAFKGDVVGSNRLPGTGNFFLPFFSSTSFLPFLTMRVCPGVCAFAQVYVRLWAGSCPQTHVYLTRVYLTRVYLAGLLTIDFNHKHSSGCILGLW